MLVPIYPSGPRFSTGLSVSQSQSVRPSRRTPFSDSRMTRVCRAVESPKVISADCSHPFFAHVVGATPSKRPKCALIFAIHSTPHILSPDADALCMARSSRVCGTELRGYSGTRSPSTVCTTPTITPSTSSTTSSRWRALRTCFARASHALLTRGTDCARPMDPCTHAHPITRQRRRRSPSLALRAQHIVGDTACGAQEMVQHTTAGYNATVFAYAAATRAHTHTHARARARTRTHTRMHYRYTRTR